MAITDEERLHRYRAVAKGEEYRWILRKERRPRWPLFLWSPRRSRLRGKKINRAGFEWSTLQWDIWQTRPIGESLWSAQITHVPENPPARRFEWITATDIWDMDAGHSASFGLAAHAAAHALRRRLVEGVSAPCMLDDPPSFSEIM